MATNQDITRRRDQVTFKGNPVCADQIIGGIIVAETAAGVRAWIERLRKRQRFNYFVIYKDVRGPAVQFGFSEWVKPGMVYIDP